MHKYSFAKLKKELIFAPTIKHITAVEVEGLNPSEVTKKKS